MSISGFAKPAAHLPRQRLIRCRRRRRLPVRLLGLGDLAQIGLGLAEEHERVVVCGLVLEQLLETPLKRQNAVSPGCKSMYLAQPSRIGSLARRQRLASLLEQRLCSC